MNTSEFDLKNHFDTHRLDTDSFDELIDTESDFGDAGLIENINSTPICQLLKIISSLPEIRQDKVVSIRRQINHGQYNLVDNLDEALDRVLEEFIADG